MTPTPLNIQKDLDKRGPQEWESAGRRGGKNNLQLAKALVYFERKRLQRGVAGEWDAN